MVRSTGTRKSGRRHRNRQSGCAHGASSIHSAASPSDTPLHGEESESASHPLPALLAGPGNEQPEPVNQMPALPMIVPQRLPAVQAEPYTAQTAQEPVRKFPAIVQAILISGCLTVALIAVIGMFRSNRVETQVARAATYAPLVVPASPIASAAPEAATTKVAAKARATQEKARAATTAHKANDMKIVHARAERTTHPASDSPRKKTPRVLAKAPNKPHEDRTGMLLAQNSAEVPFKAVGAQDEYAQCEQQSSFFRREQCKWRVCGGKWGQDGCPSYANDNREFN